MSIPKETLEDLRYFMIKDSKRRLCYYDQKSKKAYVLKPTDKKWVKLFEMRYVLSILSYFLIYLSLTQVIFQGLRPLIAFLIAFVLYHTVSLVLYYKITHNKQISKFKPKELDIFNHYEVLVQFRSLARYNLAFSVLYVLISLVDLIVPNLALWVIISSCLIASLIIGYRIYIMLAISKLTKQAKPSS